ncbi:hypothetical protein GCM10028791_25890 [Echinicola sediminis]
MEFGEFQQAMMNQPLPQEWAKVLAPIIIIAELGFAVMLVLKTTRKLGLIFSTLLMTVFTTYIGLVWTGAFERIPCSCAGFMEAMSWEEHLAFNGVFIVIGVYGIVRFNT